MYILYVSKDVKVDGNNLKSLQFWWPH